LSTRSSVWSDRGYNEVVLTGVDLTSWGADLPGAPRLGGLVQRILRLVPDLAAAAPVLDRLDRGRRR
jgi:tRNA A37 methylthiotransferase MiaB